MSRFVRIFNTSVGCKAVMALTGFALVLFVIQHCIANLQIYKGQDAMNTYAATLKSLGPLLWVARGGLLAVFALHIYCGIRLNRLNMAARKDRYQFNAFVQEDPLAQARVRAATFMFLTGVLVLLFVVYHLAHFTFGWIKADAFQLKDSEGRHDVYSMFILGFQNPLISITYILMMLVLAAHLLHGFSSAFQSLGWNHAAFNKLVRYGCPAVVMVIILLNIMMPFTILFLGFPSLPSAGG
ncbi:MAG: succinate dehydrogenase cytochrome b subunit [Pirellulales bacterium]|nr:succinate dehydrogenase cytochrome b subunit [Pirellulales bacterium]